MRKKKEIRLIDHESGWKEQDGLRMKVHQFQSLIPIIMHIPRNDKLKKPNILLKTATNAQINVKNL